MLTSRNRFRAFQVQARMGPAPGKQFVELTGHRLEGKRRMAPGTELATRSFHPAKGDPTLTVA